MPENNNNTMRNLFIVALFVMGWTAYGQEGFKGEHFIEVTGTSETEIEPNEITVLIRLKEFEENRNKTSLEKLDKDFLAALKEAGIEKKRLVLADAGSKLSRIGKKDKDAFREKSYQLVLHSASELETFMEKLEPVKVEQVSITRVHHTDFEKIRLDLKIKALQIARAKAEALLKSINGEIGKTLMVREWDQDPIHPFDMPANTVMRQKEAYGDAPEAGADQGSDVAFRKIRLRAQVTAQFEIK
jgi:uncharacterized protein